jgi:hypothetical protein
MTVAKSGRNVGGNIPPACIFLLNGYDHFKHHWNINQKYFDAYCCQLLAVVEVSWRRVVMERQWNPWVDMALRGGPGTMGG